MPRPPIRSIEFSPAQAAALARLQFAFESPAGIVLLCGPGGTGTTLVLTDLARRLAGRGAGSDADSQIWSVPRVLATVADGRALPELLLIDDAHRASGDDLAAVVAMLAEGVGDAAAPAGRPRCVVLAGRGRLLTLVARDSRIASRVRLRAIVPPFTLPDTHRFVAARLPGPDRTGPDERVVLTIHEITAGIPAALGRLVDLAVVTAGADRSLSVDDIETIHRRLDPQAV